MLPPVAQREAPRHLPSLQSSRARASRRVSARASSPSLALLLCRAGAAAGRRRARRRRASRSRPPARSPRSRCTSTPTALAAVDAPRRGHARHAAGLAPTCCMSEDAPALSGELLYAWLALYAAYFFPIRQAVFQLALMARRYLGVLVATVAARTTCVASWITLVGVLVPGRRRAAGRARRRHASSCAACPRRPAPTRSRSSRTASRSTRRSTTQLERARRDERPLTVVVGDLDHFKYVNDQLGHRAGDRALVRVARILLLRTAARATPSPAPAARSSRCCCRAPPSTRPILAAERMRAAVAQRVRRRPGRRSRSASASPPSPTTARSADAVHRVRRPGALRGQGARPQPLDHLQPRDLGDLRARGRRPRRSTRPTSTSCCRSPRRSTCATPAPPTTRGPSAATAR